MGDDPKRRIVHEIGAQRAGIDAYCHALGLPPADIIAKWSEGEFQDRTTTDFPLEGFRAMLMFFQERTRVLTEEWRQYCEEILAGEAEAFLGL